MFLLRVGMTHIHYKGESVRWQAKRKNRHFHPKQRGAIVQVFAFPAGEAHILLSEREGIA
jgi:hypothetical protein